MCRAAFAAVQKSIKQSDSAYLVNPATSLLWRPPGLERILAMGSAKLTTFDMCQFWTAKKDKIAGTGSFARSGFEVVFGQTRKVLQGWTSSPAVGWG